MSAIADVNAAAATDVSEDPNNNIENGVMSEVPLNPSALAEGEAPVDAKSKMEEYQDYITTFESQFKKSTAEYQEKATRLYREAGGDMQNVKTLEAITIFIRPDGTMALAFTDMLCTKSLLQHGKI